MENVIKSNKNYYTKKVDPHTDCSIGMCMHYDCVNKFGDNCWLVSKNKKNKNE